MKFLCVNLAKCVQDLYAENKMLAIKENPKRRRDPQCVKGCTFVLCPIHMLKPYSPDWLYLEMGPQRKELRLNKIIRMGS
jgi:hypothetical protein